MVKDYVEFKEQYEPKIRATIKTFDGLNLQMSEVNDLASELVNEFVAEDHLNKRSAVDGFGATRDFGFDKDKGAFSTYVYRFVHNRLKNMRTKRNYYTSGRFVSVYAPVGDSDDGMTVLDTIEDKKSYSDELSYTDMLEAIRVELQKMPKLGRCDLVILFESILEQVETTGRVNVVELAKKFEVSASAVTKWIKALRTVPALSVLKMEVI